MGRLLRGIKAFASVFVPEKNIAYEKSIIELELQSTKVNHILHLLLCIITAGFWVIIWIIITINTSSTRSRLEHKLKKLYREETVRNNYTNNSITPQDKPIAEPPKAREKPEEVKLYHKDQTKMDELVSLRDSDIITASEFEQKKRQILNKYN